MERFRSSTGVVLSKWCMIYPSVYHSLYFLTSVHNTQKTEETTVFQISWSENSFPPRTLGREIGMEWTVSPYRQTNPHSSRSQFVSAIEKL